MTTRMFFFLLTYIIQNHISHVHTKRIIIFIQFHLNTFESNFKLYEYYSSASLNHFIL